MVDKPQHLGPELQALAQTILAMLGPLVQAAATLESRSDGEPGKCQQVWCPVCAIAALMSGEQHPMTAVVAEHAAAALSLIRAMVNSDPPDPPDGGAPTNHHADEPAGGPGKYEPIPVTVHG